MSTVKVNAIRSTSGSSDAITLNSSSGVTAINGNALRAQNLVQNGAMTIAQRGTSATAEGYGTVDRISFHHGGEDEDGTQSQHVLTSSDTGPWEKGFRYSYHLQNGNQTGGGDAGDFCYIRSRIEAQDMATCGWDYTSASSYITLSFWVKSSVAQNFYVYVQTHDGTSQSYPFETGSLSADTWTKVTKTIPGNSNIQFDNDSDLGLQIAIAMFWGADYTASGVSLNTWGAYNDAARTPDMTSTWWTTNDATFEITGVQLEVGQTASEYMHEKHGETLFKCQRYFYMIVDGDQQSICLGQQYATNTVYGILPLPVTMRATPTIYKVVGSAYFRLFADGSYDDVDDIALSDNGTKSGKSIQLEWIDNGVSTTAGKPILCRSNNAACRLGFVADL